MSTESHSSGTGDLDPGTRDAEKRWEDPVGFRRAVLYGLCVIGVAAIAIAVFLAVDPDNMVLASTVPGVFLLGGLGSLANGYRLYRRGAPWHYWQGCAWFLLALMLVTLAFPGLAA